MKRNLGPSAPPPRNPSVPIYRASAVAIAVVLLIGIIIPIGFKMPTRLTGLMKGVWLAAIALAVWLYIYALERARFHLRDSWHERNNERLAPRRYTFWPGHYNATGRGWLLLGLVSALAWVAVMMIGL